MTVANIKSRLEKLEGAVKGGRTLYVAVMLPGLADDAGMSEKIDLAVEASIPALERKRAMNVVPICFQGMTEAGGVATCGCWWWGTA